MRLCFINDDETCRSQFKEWYEDRDIERNFKVDGVWVTDSAFEANGIVADVYIFDISAVAGMLQPHHAYSPIAKLMEGHPSAEVVIVTGFAKATVDEVCDNVEEMVDRRPWYGGYGSFTDLDRVLEEIQRKIGVLNR
jgi:hypothetical protein